MAYVRKTDTLVTEMRDRVRDMKRKAVSMYDSQRVEEGSAVYSSMRDAVETSAWSEAPEFRGKLPKAWCKEVDSASVRFVDDTGRRYFSTNVNFPEHSKLVVPNKPDRYYSYEVEVRDVHCNEHLKQWLADEKTRNEARTAVEGQYNTIEQQLMAFMAGQASLNSAIKDMPEIELYVPEKYLAKLREPNEKREKKNEQPSLIDEIGIDRDAFAAAAIAHRITTAHG